MKYYLIETVLEEIEKEVIGLYEEEKLSVEQAILILNIVRGSMEQYNSKNSRQPICRCGRCLKVLEPDMRMFSLEEEINRRTGGSWWSEELDHEVAFDTLCQECCELMMQKYFTDFQL